MRRLVVIVLIIAAINICAPALGATVQLGRHSSIEPIELSLGRPPEVKIGMNETPDTVALGSPPKKQKSNNQNKPNILSDENASIRDTYENASINETPDTVALGSPPKKQKSNNQNKPNILSDENTSIKDTYENASINETLPGEDNPIPIQMYPSTGRLPITQQVSLKETFGLNWKDKYYKIDESFNITQPAYDDAVKLIGVGFIEKPSGKECGQRAAYLEWFLQKYGINASIIVDENFPGIIGGHAWVKVTTFKKENVFIDASGFADLAKDESYVKYEDIYKSPKLNEFKDIEQALLFYGNHDGKIDFNFDWWNTGWGKEILEKGGYHR